MSLRSPSGHTGISREWSFRASCCAFLVIVPLVRVFDFIFYFDIIVAFQSNFSEKAESSAKNEVRDRGDVRMPIYVKKWAGDVSVWPDVDFSSRRIINQSSLGAVHN